MQIFSIYFWFLVWIFFKFRILIINVISRICAISTLNVVFLLLCTPPFSQIHKFTHKRVWIKTALYNNILILYIMIKNRTHKDVWKCENVKLLHARYIFTSTPKPFIGIFFFTFLHKNLEKPKCSSYLCTVIQKELVESTQTLRSSFAHRSLIVRLKQSRVYQWTKFIHFQKPKQLCVK